MGAFIGRRLAAMVPLLVLITIGVYALVLLIPGDPARTLAGGLHAIPEPVKRAGAQRGVASERLRSHAGRPRTRPQRS